MKFLHVFLQAKNDLITMEKKLEDIQGKKQVLEKVLKEKNAKANNLQEEVYVLKERLASAQSTHKRELETEKQKVCLAGEFQCLGLYDTVDREEGFTGVNIDMLILKPFIKRRFVWQREKTLVTQHCIQGLYLPRRFC